MDGKTYPVSNIGNTPAEPEFVTPTIPEPTGVVRICNECKQYDDTQSYCPIRNEIWAPFEKACEQFVLKPALAVQQLARPVHPPRRIKGAIEIYLPPDNPELAAAELRYQFDLAYMRAVLAIWERMEADSDAAI